jgi:hypothetical protein
VNEDTTPLADAAASAHEMYAELQRQGFTSKQALWLVGQMISAAGHEPPA